MVRVTSKLPAKKRKFSAFKALGAAGRAAGAQWVPGDANAPADCTYEKDLQNAGPLGVCPSG
jgi:hypothetical protein